MADQQGDSGSFGDSAKSGLSNVQKGLGTTGSTTKDATEPIPVVGKVVEGVGNTPVAEKLGGKEEEKGYLSMAYEKAGQAATAVYDAAGNAIGTVQAQAGQYIHPESGEVKQAMTSEENQVQGKGGEQKPVQQQQQQGTGTAGGDTVTGAVKDVGGGVASAGQDVAGGVGKGVSGLGGALGSATGVSEDKKE